MDPVKSLDPEIGRRKKRLLPRTSMNYPETITIAPEKGWLEYKEIPNEIIYPP